MHVNMRKVFDEASAEVMSGKGGHDKTGASFNKAAGPVHGSHPQTKGGKPSLVKGGKAGHDKDGKKAPASAKPVNKPQPLVKNGKPSLSGGKKTGKKFFSFMKSKKARP